MEPISIIYLGIVANIVVGVLSVLLTAYLISAGLKGDEKMYVDFIKSLDDKNISFPKSSGKSLLMLFVLVLVPFYNVMLSLRFFTLYALTKGTVINKLNNAQNGVDRWKIINIYK